MNTGLERPFKAVQAAEKEEGMASSLGYPINNVCSGYLEFSFGPFRLIPEQQLLLEDGEPVSVGARGLELLRVLVEHSGQVVSKDALITCIWPDTCVSENNLKVQIAALRRALGEGRRGERYVATVNGRGYRFVAPVKRQDAFQGQGNDVVTEEQSEVSRWIRSFEHNQIVEALTRELPSRPGNPVVGSGSIGQTPLALVLANLLVRACRDNVRVVELAALPDSQVVQSAIAAALAAGIPGDGGAPTLPSVRQHKSMLIVLDCSGYAAAAGKGRLDQSASEAA
jgi:DNA-binding winged helix-turn-helix (wHTH) protein